MKTVDIVQRTDEWHVFRKFGVGASTISSLIPRGSKWESFKSPYESAYGSFLSKKGLKTFSPESLEIMEKGVIFEDDARELYERASGKILLPICAIHDEFDFIRVSFDGLGMDDNIPREIKVPFNKFFFLRIKEEHKINGGKIGKYYRYYVPQVQIQMAVSGASYGEIVVYKPAEDGFKEEMVVFHVERDDEMISDLISYAKHFWEENVLKDVAPELDPEMDYASIPEEKAQEVRKLYSLKRYEEQLKEQFEAAKEATKALSESLLSEFHHPKIEGFGLRVEQKVRKGSIDYSKAVDFLVKTHTGLSDSEKKALLETFRKEPSYYVSTSFVEEELVPIFIESDNSL